MQSLTYLNGIGSSLVTYTDGRPSGVIFDRVQGKSYSFTELTLNFPVLIGGNIVEIINPAVATVRYKINLGSNLASLSYGSLPPGVTVSQSGTVYTFFGIDSVADWEAVRQPTIVIDPSLQGTFSYDATIIYNTDTTADNEFEWNVGIYVPLSQITATTGMVVTGNQIKGVFSNMVAVITQFIEGTDVLANQFILTTNAIKTARITENLPAVGTMTTKQRLWTFADSVQQIANPTPIQDSEFGKLIHVDGNNDHIITGAMTVGPPTYSYATYIFDYDTKALVQTIPYEFAHASENYLMTRAIGPGDTRFRYRLYKKTASATPYTLLSTLVLDDNPFTASYSIFNGSSMNTDNYVVIKDISVGGTSYPSNAENFEIFVYGINSTTGIDSSTLLYTKKGTVQIYAGVAFNRSQYLGEEVAVSNSYLCLSENIQINEAFPPRNRIYVYDIATGTLLRTFTNDIPVICMELDGDDLVVTTRRTFVSWNITTGNLNFNWDAIETGTNGRKLAKYDNDFWGMSLRIDSTTAAFWRLINKNNRKIVSSIAQQNSDGVYVGTDTLILGNPAYYGTYPNEGIVYIRRET